VVLVANTSRLFAHRRTRAGIQALALALLLGLCATPAAPLQSGAQEAGERANRGLELAQRGDLVGAERELRQAAKLTPNNPEILGSLGTILAMQKKLEASASVFKQTLKLRPDDLDIRRYLAANLWQLHRFSEAKANLEVLLRQKPDDRQGRLLMGMVAENTRDYATAAKMLSSVPEEVRQRPESVAALARAYYHLGDEEKARGMLAHLSGAQQMLLGAAIADEMHDYTIAETMLESLRSQAPGDVNLEFRLALVQYHAGKLDDAKQILLAAIGAGPATSQMYNLLGWCYYTRGDSKEAVQAFDRAIELAPQDETNYFDLTNMLVANSSFPAALAAVRKATTALPKSPGLFEMRGSIEQKVGQFRDAEESYSHALRLDPKRPGSTIGLAESQFSAGSEKESIATFENALRRFPKDAQVRVSYGVVLLKEAETGDPRAQQRAEQMFRAALALAPDSAAAHYQLGKLVLEKGSVSEAIQQLEKAVNLNPNSAEARFSLARAYRRAGKSNEANREMDIYQKLKSEQRDANPQLQPMSEPRSH
jgi:tetratricopeptide (TPR) repeat protein